MKGCKKTKLDGPVANKKKKGLFWWHKSSFIFTVHRQDFTDATRRSLLKRTGTKRG